MELLYKYGRYFLIAAAAGEMLVPFLLALFYEGYKHTTMVISLLGNTDSPVRLPFNIWMLSAGLLFLLAVPWLYHSYNITSKALTIVMVSFISIFAIGACIFSCFFSVNRSKEIVTTASKIHGIGSVIGFMLMLFVPLLLAVLFFKRSENGSAVIAMVCFVLAMVFFILFVMADKAVFHNTIIAKEGLWQRLNLLFMYLPLAWAAFNHMQTS